MKLYRLGKLHKIYPPADEVPLGILAKEYPDIYEASQKHARELAQLMSEYDALTVVYQDVDETKLSHNRKDEYKRWQELDDQFNPVFVEDPKMLARLSRGEDATITELSIPDDHQVLNYLEPVTGKTKSVTYRISSDVLWEHLGKARDWNIRFRTLSRGFEQEGSEILQQKKSELTLNADKKIMLYHSGKISRFFSPQDAIKLKENRDALEKLREKYGSDTVMERRDKHAYQEWLKIKDSGNGVQVYLTEEDARSASGDEGTIVVFTIPEASADILNTLREEQDADQSFLLPWALLWENVVQGRKWTQEQRIPAKKEGEISPVQSEANNESKRKKFL